MKRSSEPAGQQRKPLVWFAMILGGYLITKFTNWLSYRVMKTRTLRRRKWDLNICCGYTDGGGVNADIVRHASLPNFVLTPNIYHLPFADGQFEHVLCSHTIEHVEDAPAFWRELNRVGKHVTLVVPPLWDSTAAFNLFEHRWLFLTWRKEHHTLPPHIRLPLADMLQGLTGGQRVKA